MIAERTPRTKIKVKRKLTEKEKEVLRELEEQAKRPFKRVDEIEEEKGLKPKGKFYGSIKISGDGGGRDDEDKKNPAFN